jgi:signal transduction histidine kinase
MSSKIDRPNVRSAAWRISLWATLAFACGTLLVFVVLHRFVAEDIQRRSDAWLSGEVEVLGDVAEHTPKDRLYSRFVGEVAELASREVPNKLRSSGPENDSVFFLQSTPDGAMNLWVGSGDGASAAQAIREAKLKPEAPSDLKVGGFPIPFRVASLQTADGGHIYLGLSERDELRVLRNFRIQFVVLGLVIVLFGFLIVFYATRRMLGHVRRITEAASVIGQSDISSRVPSSENRDEVAQLAWTLNHMLDRIESSMHQLHTITDSLAHDLRSPLTAIRGKLEMYLSSGVRSDQGEPIVSAIDELDRLTEFLNSSLDVAEAKADALRLNRSEIDLDDLMRSMIDLYEPSMSEKGLGVQLQSGGSVVIDADAALVHRMVANLLDNEIKHLPPSCNIRIGIRREELHAVLIVQDDGPGFSYEVVDHMFEQRTKGRNSTGHGLGLAFVAAVARAHGGSVAAFNRPSGGAQLEISLPLAIQEREASIPLTMAFGSHGRGLELTTKA